MVETVVPQSIDGGESTEVPATFYVSNKIYEGFKNLRLSRNLTSLTGSFEITLIDKWQVEQEDFDLKPGLEISCKIGKDLLYTGYIDRFSISLSSSSRNLTITGRDKTGDLVDCSVLGKNEFNNMKLEAIAKELISPFGIDVLIFSDTGDVFKKFTIQQGETVFNALERLAKQRKLLLTSSPSGKLVFEKKGAVRSSTELIEGVNILSAGATFDNSERFSEYHVKGQAPGILGNANDATKGKGISKDFGITRFRPLIILSENSSNADDSQKRSQWESSIRAAKGTQVNIVVRDWIQKDGELWATNQTVAVDCKSIGIKQDLMIKTVKFELGSGGKVTELELIRPDAFEFNVDVKKENDPLDILGWDAKK